jgi:hypothetical protein
MGAEQNNQGAQAVPPAPSCNGLAPHGRKMTIRGRGMPLLAVEAMAKLVREVPGSKLVEFYGDDVELMKGFRPGSADAAEAVRRRLLRRLSTGSCVSVRDAGFLAAAGLNRGLVAVLSHEALDRVLPCLVAVFGEGSVVLGLLLDDRDEVRALASELAEGKRAPYPDKDKARRRVTEELGLFLSRLAELAPAREEEGQQDRRLEEKIAELETNCRDLSKERKACEHEREHAVKQADKLERENTQLKADKRETQERAEAAGARASRAEDQTKKLEKKLKDMEQNTRDAIRKGVGIEVAAMAHRWMRRPETVTAALSSNSHDVLEAAESALRRQADVDAHCGNLRELRNRLEQAERMREAISEARREALNPLPELGDLERSLDQDIRRLRAALAVNSSPVQPAVQALLKHINTAPDSNLAHVGQLLSALQEFGVFAFGEMRLLYGKYRDRLSRLYDPYLPPATRASAPPSGTGRLGRLLADRADTMIAIDGYNVLLVGREAFESFLEDSQPRQKARQELVDRVRLALGESPACEARVYFDAPKVAAMSETPSIRVVFSGGQGVHRADQVILAELEYERKERPARALFLVSDDNELRRNAKLLGVDCVAVAEFVAFVE